MQRIVIDVPAVKIDVHVAASGRSEVEAFDYAVT